MHFLRPPCLKILAVCLLAVSPLPALAQGYANREAVERMDRLERDLMLLQRRISRGGLPAGDYAGGEGAAGLELRFSALEEELRALRGKIEENEFQIRRLHETLSKFQQDVDFRLNEISAAAPPPEKQDAPTRPEKKRPAGNAEAIDTGSEARKATDADHDEAPNDRDAPRKTTAGDGTLRLPPEGTEDDAFENPRDHYNHAFRLLNQSRYEDAAHYFETFAHEYPKDPLIGNAYYWLGETHYIRRDYVKAADNFRQGFEVLPGGPKAADNLLKLSMSLSAMQKNKEACVVLDQLLVKFRETSTAVAQKAEQERTRIGCK